MNKYIVDSNFFIQAHRSIYPLDVVQSFWLKVNALSQNGTLVSIDKVKKEIYDNSSHEDELKLWCDSNLPNSFFINTDKVLQNYITIVGWIGLIQCLIISHQVQFRSFLKLILLTLGLLLLQ